MKISGGGTSRPPNKDSQSANLLVLSTTHITVKISPVLRTLHRHNTPNFGGDLGWRCQSVVAYVIMKDVQKKLLACRKLALSVVVSVLFHVLVESRTLEAFTFPFRSERQQRWLSSESYNQGRSLNDYVFSHLQATEKVEIGIKSKSDTHPGQKRKSSEPPSRIKGSADTKPKKKLTRTKKRAKRKNSKTPPPTEPLHWTLSSDPVVWISTNGNTTSASSWQAHTQTINGATATALPELVRFTIRGNPLPLRRHRTSRGFVYNPSAKAQISFRETVQNLLCLKPQTLDATNDTTPSEEVIPLFGSETALAMTIAFRTKRPNRDFVGSRPGAGRLRPTTNTEDDNNKGVAPSRLWPPTRTDVDNLAKFVLDSVNGLLYDDDRQVVSLSVTKLRDDEDECRGSTEVCIRVLSEDDLERLLNRTFDLF